MLSPAFLPPVSFLNLLNLPVNPPPAPNTENKQKPRHAGFPPLSLFAHSVPPKSPTLHQFTRRIPKYLHNITFLRNGPGVYSYPHKSGPPWVAHHLFDGIAVLHSLTISANSKPTLSHTSDFVDNHFIKSISTTPHALFAPIQIYHPSTLPRLINLFARDFDYGILHNLPVTVEQFPTLGTVARSDVSVFQQIHPRTLSKGSRIRLADLNPSLGGQQSASHGCYFGSHYYNYVSNLLKCNVFSVGPNGQITIIAKVRPTSKFIHALAATQNYVILPQLPFTINIPKFLFTKSVLGSIQQVERSASFVVIDRRNGGIVAEFCVDPFFMFHFVNAYEEDDNIIIDTCAYENADVLDQLRMDSLGSNKGIDSAVPKRFVLRDISAARSKYPKMARAEEHSVGDTCFEFPTVHPKFRGRKNRFAYGIGDCERKLFLGELVKLDVETGETKTWSQKGTFVGEPVFVPRDSKREDDGCLLTIVTYEHEDAGDARSALVVIDARTMKEISRAELGFSMALGFHASALKTEGAG